jgi:hypothetical protein
MEMKTVMGPTNLVVRYQRENLDSHAFLAFTADSVMGICCFGHNVRLVLHTLGMHPDEQRP